MRHLSLRTVLAAQGGYYLVTGAWSAFAPGSFERFLAAPLNRLQLRVTGSLFMAVGATLLAGRRQQPPSAPVVLLAVLTALGAIHAEVRNPEQLPRALILDLLVEAAFVAAILACRKRRLDRSPHGDPVTTSSSSV